MRAAILIAVVSLASVSFVAAQSPSRQAVPRPPTFDATVVSIFDGDSFIVLDGRRQVEVRLHGVDAPEGGQAFGTVCRRMFANLVFGKTVTVRVMETDRYDRRVSRVTINGADVGLTMIREGCAWHYTQYSDDPEYAAAERDARRSRRGLWQDARPTPPWTFRQRKRTHTGPGRF